jgi:subtilase family serine protease
MARALEHSDRDVPIDCLDATADVPVEDGSTCDVTLYLRPAGGADRLDEAASALVADRLAGRPVAHLSSAEGAKVVRPDRAEQDAVVAALRAAGIPHVHAVGVRAIHVQGRWEDLGKVLSVDRIRYRTSDGVLVGRAGPIMVTDDALDPVVAVFGLDNRRAVSSYVIKSHVIKSHVIKSHVIKSHVIKSHVIKSHVIKSHVIKSHVIKSHVIKSHGNLRAEMTEATADPDREWFTPEEVADWYDFPAGTGAGVRVGVLAFSGALGGTDQVVMGGYHEEPLIRYWRDELGLPTSPTLTSVVVRGPGNWPSDGEDSANSVDFTDEVMLDLSVVGALAPAADIAVYFTEPTEQGFVDALHHIVELDVAPDVLVICYGAPEDKGSGTSWTTMATEQSDQALAVAALRGISVVVSCGDNGAAGMPLSTRVHADYPASSPWVLGCGGTTVLPDNAGTDREIVWNDGLGASGGGVSAITPRPSWQDSAGVPDPVDAWERPDFHGRGVPDVSAVADLTTGVAVVDAAGNTVMGGGTSVSAPVWAALLARCREQSGAPLGFVTPLLYERRSGVRDVPKGDNGAYAAKAGAWDPCTGLGVPDGRTICDVVRRGLTGTT